MLDSDLAELYGVETRVLNQSVKRNSTRFPDDFMFQVSENEMDILTSQIVMSKKYNSRGGNRKLPYAFTEQGISMLSSVLNSERAIQVNIAIIRLFTQLRQIVLDNKDVMLKLSELENIAMDHDAKIRLLFDYINELMIDNKEPRPRIGYK